MLLCFISNFQDYKIFVLQFTLFSELSLADLIDVFVSLGNVSHFLFALIEKSTQAQEALS